MLSRHQSEVMLCLDDLVSKDHLYRAYDSLFNWDEIFVKNLHFGLTGLRLAHMVLFSGLYSEFGRKGGVFNLGGDGYVSDVEFDQSFHILGKSVGGGLELDFGDMRPESSLDFNESLRFGNEVGRQCANRDLPRNR